MATDYSWVLQDPNVASALSNIEYDRPNTERLYLDWAQRLGSAIPSDVEGMYNLTSGGNIRTPEGWSAGGGMLSEEIIRRSPQYAALPPADKQQFESMVQQRYAANKSGGLLGGLKITGNPFKDAKSIVKNDQRNVGKVVETLQPVVEHALRNNPATLVAGADKQAAKGLGWNWLEHMTGKTDQTFERTSNKAAGFQEVFERQLAERMQRGESMPQAINNARLEADRAHARTNSAQTIQEGINRGEYRVTQGGDVVDRYGNTVLGKGLAQRGTTALQVASLAFPILAPIAAAAQTATAYRHGAPAGKAMAQGLGSYYAGQLGGQYGGQLGGRVGAAAGSGAARGLTSGYAQGLRGGELLEAGALGGLSGGLGSWAGGYGSNPFMSGLLSGGARGLVSGYRQGDIGQGIQQGLLSGGLSGAGNMAAQQYGQWARPIPQFAYRQLMQRG